MAVRELPTKPEPLAHFPDDGGYRWLEMHREGLTYGYAAIVGREDALELHVTLLKWGSKIRQSIREDVRWLKREARRLGKSRIMGVRVNALGEFDSRLFKFARMFGFTDMCVLQTASLHLE